MAGLGWEWKDGGVVAVGGGWYASVLQEKVQGVVRGSGGKVGEITSLGPVKDNRS